MEEINIKDLLNYFKSKLVYILLIVLATTLLGVIYKTMIEKPIYKSTTSLILTGFTDSNGNDTINNNDLTINQKLLATYQQIAKSRKVLLQVISELNLDYSAEELAQNISVTGVADTEIIKITVSDGNANRAYHIAKKVANIFSDEVRDFYKASNVSVLDVPEVAEAPSNMSFAKAILIFIVGGLILASLVIFVVYYFDTTIKTTEQLETRLDIPVLGSIPNYNESNTRGKKQWMN